MFFVSQLPLSVWLAANLCHSFIHFFLRPALPPNNARYDRKHEGPEASQCYVHPNISVESGEEAVACRWNCISGWIQSADAAISTEQAILKDSLTTHAGLAWHIISIRTGEASGIAGTAIASRCYLEAFNAGIRCRIQVAIAVTLQANPIKIACRAISQDNGAVDALGVVWSQIVATLTLNAEIAGCTAETVGGHSRTRDTSVGRHVVSENTAYASGHTRHVLAGKAKTKLKDRSIISKLVGIAVLASLVWIDVVWARTHETGGTAAAENAVGEV
jgi:hypothetical protein